MDKNLDEIKDLKQFSFLLKILLENIGFKDIEIISCQKLEIGILTFTEKSFLETIHRKMFFIQSNLNGKLELLSDIIKENSSSKDVIIITTSANKISNYFKEWIQEEFIQNKFDFWNDQKILLYIEEYYPQFWDNKDTTLKFYEDKFANNPDKEVDLSKYLNLDKKYKDYLNIFIEPKIFINKNSNGKKTRTKTNINRILNEKSNYIISGDAGTGKSTILNELGLTVLEKNKSDNLNVIPVFLKARQISENNFKILDSINSYIQDKSTYKFDNLLEKYSLLILIDSIDEFEIEIRDKILSELNELAKKKIRFIIATRNSQNLIKQVDLKDFETATVSNFDLNQVRLYLTTFFKHDLHKSEELWQNLKENHVLEKIPTTPLTLSLISILFEERGFEIPATLTDIYDNFNTLLLGRLTVKNNLDYLTVTVKEKLLSLYALSILQKDNRDRLKKDDFISFATDYFSSQGKTVDVTQIPDLLLSLTDGTGILHLDENEFVNFNHDHFLEYYASREIFQSENRQHLEDEIIEKFIEFNWQNVAIFYTGRTKDMKIFLSKLLKKIDTYKYINEYLLSISGLGYVLQSLWLTNSENRKEGVIKALELLLKVDAEIKNMSIREDNFFNGINENVIALVNLSWFYNNFNSISLKDPLELAFDELYNKLKKTEGSFFKKNYNSEAYKLFCIATVLQHGRTGQFDKMNLLFEEENILTIPLFTFLFNNAIDLFELHNKQTLKIDYKMHSKVTKYARGINYYLENDTSKTLFTDYEQLVIPKKIHLITEGKSDAMIINHAFLVLTEKSDPYWSIESVEHRLGVKSGGARELSKFLKSLTKELKTEYDLENSVVGIFDNDSKGFQEFNGLESDFLNVDINIKKHKILNIYALLLPIPTEDGFEGYEQPKQNLKFFEIEHYFPLLLLKDNNMVSELPIPDVYEIKDNKVSFAKKINEIYDPEIFKNFRYLFEDIDLIFNKKVNYIC